MSFARSVTALINTHNSEGLKDPPNVNCRYMNAHIAVEHRHFAADAAFMCIHLYADFMSYFEMRMIVCGNTYLMACIMCNTRTSMNPYIRGLSSFIFTLSFIDIFDLIPG